MARPADLVGWVVGRGMAVPATVGVVVVLVVRVNPVATTTATDPAYAQHGGDNRKETNRCGRTNGLG